MKRLILVLLSALPLSTFAAEIFRWVDANGVTHFSQDAPVNAPYQRITPNPPPPNPSPHVEGLRKTQAADTKAEGEANKTREAGLKLKADTLERCAKARERITFLEEKTARRLFKVGPDGEQARYTDDDFQTELTKANSAAEQSCT